MQHRARLWIAALVVALGLQVAGYFLLSRQCAIGLGCDAYGYIAAARAVAAGGDPYAETLPISHADGRTATLSGHHYLYPPPLAVALAPLTWLGPRAEIPVWMALVAVSTGLLVVALRPLLGWRLAALTVLGFMPTWETFRMGQINSLVALLTALAIVNAARPARAAAALTAGALLKIMPALGLAALAIRAPRRTLLGAAAVGGAALALTLPFVGLDGWLRGLTIAWQVRRSTDGMAAVGPLLSTLPGALGRAAPTALALGLLLASLVRGRRIAPADALAALSLIPIIAAPIVWTHHLVMALPALAVLWARGGRAAWLAGATWLAGAFVAGQMATLLLLPLCWAALCWPAILNLGRATAAPQPPPLEGPGRA